MNSSSLLKTQFSLHSQREACWAASHQLLPRCITMHMSRLTLPHWTVGSEVRGSAWCPQGPTLAGGAPCPRSTLSPCLWHILANGHALCRWEVVAQHSGQDRPLLGPVQRNLTFPGALHTKPRAGGIHRGAIPGQSRHMARDTVAEVRRQRLRKERAPSRSRGVLTLDSGAPRAAPC